MAHVQGDLTSALAKAARLDLSTPFEPLADAVRQEAEHITAELLRWLVQLPERERASDVFREVSGRLELRARTGLHAAELEYLRRRAEALQVGGVTRALGAALHRLRELEARVEWLVRGTTPTQLAALHPMRDSDRLYHHLSSTFRAEARVLETLAINRVATWETLALFLRSTREAERNPVGRFFDTYALFANFFEWGELSQRGSRAIQRMNQIHGRYFIPNEGMKYVLLNTAFTWLDGVDRIGHRPLLPLEREGFFHAHIRMGRAMQIAELTDDYAEMYAWFRQVNAENAFHTPFKTETFETFVGNSFGPGAPERDVMLTAARVAMDEHYRSALGYAAPSARELDAVRAAMLELTARTRARPGAIFVRSLARTPLRGEAADPSELGVSQRSPSLPCLDATASNAGYPEWQTPVKAASSVAAADLPIYCWDEIRRHASAASTWLVIDGDVYDVSSFIEQHPGGAELLGEWAGRDASRAFHGAPHGPLTRIFRFNYRIGRVVEPEPKAS